ncbi:class I adenylate-forming enzyme family protein [Pseudonocardia sp. MH-G8]|uniref:class I adenylate-forming enzyme family protein n=1 Tax=Pseudonocardia sp. MH-G8 TaxID=1854588 RepID=UPI000BA06EB7|nr:AMP-binding protein [Pseudonocardia sp. MH-G8]OZM78029.1 AMP-dependent synthetase [Pseudonocardia sp. MH-G8]
MTTAHPPDLTLRTLFASALDRFGERPALVFADRTWSYRELARDANRLAHALVAAGVGPGTPVALMMSNRAEYVIADQAVLRCGAAKVPINDMLSPSEIAYILCDSGAVVALADEGMAPAALAADAPALHTVVLVGDGDVPGTTAWLDVFAGTDADAPPDVAVAGGDVGMIAYTGGTTGRQKGVVHTQRGLAVNILAHAVEMALGDDERLLLTSPLPHSAGFVLQAGLLKGALHLLERRFDPEAVLQRIACDRATFLFMVPTMIYRLLDRAEGRQLDLSSLRTILYGAAPITRERLEQGLHRLGPVFMQLYGQTEAPNFLTRLTREDHDPAHPERLGSCGRAASLAEVAILDEDGAPVPAGEPGEVCARAPYVMAGYHGLPEKTAETLRGGWLHTGDLGRMDVEGYVYLLDRKNDMIISGGMNVYSTEVENVVQGCPGVAQVAVAGVPHPDWGEAVVAFVVASGAGFDEPAAAATCRAELAAYKRPKAYRRIDALPVTPYGKVDKKALRATWPGW